MPKGPFDGSQFIATQWSSAAEKAAFGNTFLHFTGADWKEALFTKSFYNRLSMCFGHIAHYDRSGFWETWFTSDKSKYDFLRHTLQWPCHGDPTFTFCDVERAIQQEILCRNYLALYQLKAAQELRSAEMSLLQQLEAKYRTAPKHQPIDLEPAKQVPLVAATPQPSAPVQGLLF
jgi:hypothetical protein